MSTLYRFIYTSARTSDCTDSEIDNILSSARKNNPSLGLTGLLLHTNSRFLQILEGDKEKIESLYVKILEDKRHIGATKKFMEPVEERMFGNWSMGYKDLEDIHLYDSINDSDKKVIDDLKNSNLDKLDTKDLRMIKAFVKVG